MRLCKCKQVKFTEWHPYFAWWPVNAAIDNYGYCYAWLETVHRRFRPNGLDWSVHYKCIDPVTWEQAIDKANEIIDKGF